ncbi:MAG: alpha/beta hydrolase [Candidatus Odinarchaeota archaeon]
MQHQEDYFETDRGCRIYYQSWRSENEIKTKAIVMITHGIAEHGGRYLNVVNHLVPAGYIVYANDNQGHGKSEGQRGFVDRLRVFADDLYQFNRIIREKEGNELPLVLLGHSMGSAVAVNYASRYSETINGLVLSGCGSKPGYGFNPVILLVLRLISRLLPRKGVTTDPQADQLSHDPEVVKAYLDDPLVCVKQVTFRLAGETIEGLLKAPKLAKMIKLPVLLQKGGKDSIVLEEKKLFEALSSEDKMLKVYPELYHEVYNELPEMRGKVLVDLQAWLDEHTK